MTKQEKHSKTTTLSLLVRGKPDVLHGMFERRPFSLEKSTPGSHIPVASSLLALIWYTVLSYQFISVLLYCIVSQASNSGACSASLACCCSDFGDGLTMGRSCIAFMAELLII